MTTRLERPSMNSLQCISPIDGSVYVERPLANSTQIADAVARAERAQQDWKSTPLAQRIALTREAIRLFSAKESQLAEELCWMMGRPIRYAAGEINGFVERASHMADIAERALADIHLPEKPGFIRFIRREPLGVVLVIAPWNYPYLTAVNSVVPALLAGNSVLLKHSAQTPLCAERMVEAFAEAGLPAGVFQYLHLSHEDTEQLIRAPAVRHVAFTGSEAGGAMVEHAAAGRFIGSGLELGGKDPAYVRADADLRHAVETTIDGAFFNSGQSCCAIERIYVHESLYDGFVEQAVALVRHYRLGRPDSPKTTLGPLVRPAAADFVREQIAEAVAKGAKTHIDPADFPLDQPGSAYLAPQVLTGVNHAMRVMTEESFGPVVGIQKVRDDDEALALMNDSDFGLTAAIFSRDETTALALADRLDTGTVFLNRCDYLDPALAWTGVKNSGRGCTLSTLGYDHLTRPKSFHFKTQL
jgi:acyl-CoA reductase-like NAD-dependent aldehyde dehydrogenase